MSHKHTHRQFQAATEPFSKSKTHRQASKLSRYLVPSFTCLTCMTGGHKQLHELMQCSLLELLPIWSIYTYLVTMAPGKVRSFLEYTSYTSNEDQTTVVPFRVKTQSLPGISMATALCPMALRYCSVPSFSQVSEEKAAPCNRSTCCFGVPSGRASR